MPPRHRDPGLPRDLEAICLKASAFDPRTAIPPPRDLAEDLENWLADEPVSAWREPLSDRARRWMQATSNVVASAAAAVLVGMLALWNRLLTAVVLEPGLSQDQSSN